MAFSGSHTPESFRYSAIHVFLPIKPPRESDWTSQNDHALARSVSSAAQPYATYLRETSQLSQWHRVMKMLYNLQSSAQTAHFDRSLVLSQLQGMQTGDIIALFIPGQNASILLTKWDNVTLCETFEVCPSANAINKTPGPLLCSYPESAVEIPNKIFQDGDFQSDLAGYLSSSNTVDSDSPNTYSQFINTLLNDVFPSEIRTVDVPRVTKRVRDYADEHSSTSWRRSPLWLLIKVAIHVSAMRSSNLGNTFYKQFILFFMCTLAQDANITSLSHDLLHLMSSQILRRLSKIGSAPDWLSEMALTACATLRGILDAKWEDLSVRPSLFQSPSRDELARDSQLSLLNSREYIRNILENHDHDSVCTTFQPNHRRRGTLDDFLSSDGNFFNEAFKADPDATIYDVECTVEEGIDDWLSRVTDVDDACTQLEILMDRYVRNARSTTREQLSIKVLTVIELYVALDKLVVKEVPLLTDYPPEVPLVVLKKLLLRKTTSLHRVSCAYQYLAARYSQANLKCSVLSNEFTEESFPVRYYDQSPDLQRLRARIEDGMKNQHPLARSRELADNTETSQPLMPVSILLAKVVVFELQCPSSVRIWRSAAPRVLMCFWHGFSGFGDFRDGHELSGSQLLLRIPAFQPYLVDRRESDLSFHLQFAYFYPEFPHAHSSPSLGYVFRYPIEVEDSFSRWDRKIYISTVLHDSGNTYIHSTSHTSNYILSTQAKCPADLTLDEYIAYGHLRSGGSLQWLNILRGLRSRTLNLHRLQIHELLARATLEVGPLDPCTGTLIWHQELQDASFCRTLLDELEGLLMGVGAGLVDGVLMHTMSSLLTRVLAASPGEEISEQIIALLRGIRRKTFRWVQELAYDLAKPPMNKDRMDLLLDMAATCRSTFDVDSATLHRLFHSPEDVDALLSCAFFVHALQPGPAATRTYYYSRLLLDRDRRLSYTLEGVLRNTVLTDPTNYGIDLAVSRIFTRYRLSAQRWEQLQHPHDRWLTCQTSAITDQSAQTVHINLLLGELRVAGRALGGLPQVLRRSPEYLRIFHDQSFFVIPSNLPGMDLMTVPGPTKSDKTVHFSARENSFMLRVQHDQTDHTLWLIPPSKFLGDLPTPLIDGHVHWLKFPEKIIEIRPLERLWEESSEHWKIDCAAEPYRMYRGYETLVDINSPTYAMISKCFDWVNRDKPDPFKHTFELSDSQIQSMNLLIATSPIAAASTSVPSLSVTLSDYDLTFFVNESEELESQDFKHMVYDENQCIAALFGLRNILVLRPKTHIAGALVPEALFHRRIIVPFGEPVKRGHRQDRESPYLHRRGALFHTYTVDTELGCLIGDGSPSSTEILARLYARSSWHKPDPLTGKTGAQAALTLLKSGGCRSIVEPKSCVEGGRNLGDPRIDAAYEEIRQRYYWERILSDREPISTPTKRAVERAAHLFPSDATGPVVPEDYSAYTAMDIPSEGLHSLPHAVSSLRHLFHAGTATQVSLGHLISSRPAPELLARIVLPRDSYTTSSDAPALDQLFSQLPTDRPFQREYLTLLNASAQHVRMESHTVHRVLGGPQPVEALKEHYLKCRAAYLDSLDTLKECLGPTSNTVEQALDLFGRWPPITADVLLRYLGSTSRVDIPQSWKICLISFALLLLDLQRSRRLLQYWLDGLEEEFSKELENEGCEGWVPAEHPDWLLIQIQGNFLIRRSQADAAMEIMSPESGENTVTQVTMGEGKSSVIIPIVAAALADGKQLVRVIVPKALTVQMLNLLIARLGWLLNRPIYHLPFSRTPKYGEHRRVITLQIDDLHKLLRQCMAERGVLIVHPEHVMSLKLMSIEQQIPTDKLTADLPMNLPRSLYKRTTSALRALAGQRILGSIFKSNQSKGENPSHGVSGSASEWTSLQIWIHSHVQDILDESDVILHSRFQLVYTLGSAQHLDGYPDRWTITQQVLRLVKQRIFSLARHAPASIQYECDRPGSFPQARIVRASDIGRRLISSIAQDVMDGRLANFNFRHLSPALQNSIRSFISDEDVLQIPDTVKRVEEYAKGSEKSHLWSGLLLLRGLLTSNLLVIALAEWRWRVDYGLVQVPIYKLKLGKGPRHEADPTVRTLLAVPFRAKDVPAPNTQFAHPDLTIILTCLSYYYAGLSNEQLKTAFEILLSQDYPAMEYANWLKEYDRDSVPDSLRQLSEINLGSSEQWDNVIYRFFAWNQAAVDFYLSRVVFPKEAKGFPWKLSVSSWDLAEERAKLTTGFSGTNDAQWLLPLSIAQRDLNAQKGTNAQLLAYLLRPENDSYMMAHEHNQGWSTPTFLKLVATQQPEIRVLLDVGSQILDLSNREVAEEWLKITHRAAGAIYFSDNDELLVLSRNGSTFPMLSSSLSQQLDRCVVYLDHAHTRGTDINLPIGSRAAVTLGPKVTKDALVQGCMRMRKLGHGHSVMFFAPPKVDWSIRTASRKTLADPNAQVTVVDILCWAIHETWADIRQQSPFWAQQGMNHRLRHDAWSRFVDGQLTKEKLAEAWLQPDCKSLEVLYAPGEAKNTSIHLSELDSDIRQRCKDLGILSLPSALIEEEQEREVQRERERERDVELPSKAEPAKHHLHADLVKIVKTGVILPKYFGSVFHPAFRTLEKNFPSSYKLDIWSSSIVATADFSKTINNESTGGTMGQYLRPVQWILSTQRKGDHLLILLSPFEVSLLLPDIRVSEHVHLHLYAPRTSKRVKPSDDLRLYSIPPLPSDWTPPGALIDQLNVFSGQLYLRDYESYLRLGRLLTGTGSRPATKEPLDDSMILRSLLGIRASLGKRDVTSSQSPLAFVKALLGVRTRGLPFAHTHMGKILQGQLLTEKDFQSVEVTG